MTAEVAVRWKAYGIASEGILMDVLLCVMPVGLLLHGLTARYVTPHSNSR